MSNRFSSFNSEEKSILMLGLCKLNLPIDDPTNLTKCKLLDEVIEWLVVHHQNVVRCMYETIRDALTVTPQYLEKKRGLKFETGIKKTWMDFCLFSWEYQKQSTPR